MHLRLRSLIAPAARIGVWLLRRFDASPRAVDASYYLSIILASGVFLWLASTPYSQTILAFSVALVFVSGLMEEVRRQYGLTDTEPSRYADFILYGGVLYYLLNVTYENFYVTRNLHFFLGAALVGGVLLLNRVLEFAVKGERPAGLEMPGERMLFFTVFAVTGYNHRAYSDFLLAGLAALTAVLYMYSVFLYARYRGVSISTRRVKSFLARVVGIYQAGGEKIETAGRAVYRLLQRAVPAPPSGEALGHEAAPQAAAHGYNYTVMVLDAGEQPVADALVTMASVDGAMRETRYTDAQGKCVFSNLREGQYSIAIEAEGLPGKAYERYINMDSGEVFRLETGLSDLSVVVNDGREMRPIPDALVTLEAADGRRLENRTDNLGVAYFDRLPGGKAVLNVEAEGYVGKTRRVDPAVENVVSLNLMRKQLVEIHGSLLVEYMEHGEAEEAVRMVIEAFREGAGKTCLVSASDVLDKCGVQGIMLVDFSSSLPEDIEVVLAELPRGGALLFEAVTDLVHRLGLEEALRFTAKLLRYARERGVSVVAFINKGAHGERIAAMFEELFEEVAEYREGRLVEKGAGAA
jgi:hypothetical protein